MEEHQQKYRFLSGEPAFIEAALRMTRNAFSNGCLIRIAFPYDLRLLPLFQADLSHFLCLENIKYQFILEKSDQVHNLVIRQSSERALVNGFLSKKGNYIRAILVLFHNAQNLGCTELIIRTEFSPEMNIVVMADIVQLFKAEKLVVNVFEKDGYIIIQSIAVEKK